MLANPVPGQFVAANLKLTDKHNQVVDGSAFAPITWTSSDENILAPVGPLGGPTQYFEARNIGEAKLTAKAPGLTEVFSLIQRVDHPAGIQKGAIEVTGPLSSLPAPVLPAQPQQPPPGGFVPPKKVVPPVEPPPPTPKKIV